MRHGRARTCPPTVSIAAKMTLPVWTLANTPPRTTKVWASMNPLLRVSSSANHSVLARSVSSGPAGGPTMPDNLAVGGFASSRLIRAERVEHSGGRPRPGELFGASPCVVSAACVPAC